MPTIGLYELNSIPIHQIDFTNPAEKKKHDEIVKHVETMLELNKELQKAKLASEQEQIKQRITYTDKKIDSLVYELYGLTEEEIKVIEN
jgi:DNA-binding transcriptional regulator GbsR (MarR family)